MLSVRRREMSSLLNPLLPSSVIVAERSDDDAPTLLFPEEEAVIASAAPRRRAEFATTRSCAREALAALGVGPVAVPTGPGREPVWPVGIVGALTHCDGYRAAALARDTDVLAVGVDAEPHAPLSDGVERLIASSDEIVMLDGLAGTYPDVSWRRVFFSAKESVYKAWYPLTKRWLDFADCALTLRPNGTFTGRLLVPGPVVGDASVWAFDGRWRVIDGLVLTAVALTCAPTVAAGDLGTADA